MRIQLIFKLKADVEYAPPNKHAVQGLLYKLLSQTSFKDVHNDKFPKNFSFSDFYPAKFHEATYNLMFASPNERLTKELFEVVRNFRRIITFRDFTLQDCRFFSGVSTLNLATGSPIVLIKDSDKNEYYSFDRKTIDVMKFNEHLKASALVRYRSFSGDSDYTFDGPLFRELEFSRELAVPVTIAGRRFPVIGSTWKQLILASEAGRSEFNSWLQDAGIGQKTALGFGFLKLILIPGQRRKRRIMRVIN